jgi:hypothetical protein
MTPALALGLPPSWVMKFLRALGIRPWDWRTCWREADFWLAMATLLLPFGFLLLLRHWAPVRVRIRPRH